MARKPAIRENYRQDAITIHRIIGAIELDPASSDRWKNDVNRSLHEAMRLLLDHERLHALKKAG